MASKRAGAKSKNGAKKKAQATEAIKEYSMPNLIVSGYLALLFAVFPLYLSEQYKSVRHDKLFAFMIFSLFLLAIMIAYQFVKSVGRFQSREISAEASDISDNLAFFKLLSGSLAALFSTALITLFVTETIKIDASKYPNENIGDVFQRLLEQNFSAFVFIIIFSVLSAASVGMYIYCWLACNKGERLSSLRETAKKLSATDIFFIGFMIVSVLSTLFSDNFLYSLFGTNGRNNGLQLLLVYAAVYFILSRRYYYSELVFVIFGLSCAVVCIIAFMHYFYIDPFGIYNNYKESTKNNFLTTIGNKNFFSAVISVCLPLFSTLYIMSKNKALKYFYLIIAGICFIGLVVSDSDSGYMGLAAFLMGAALVCCRKYRLLKRLFLLGAVLLFSGKMIFIAENIRMFIWKLFSLIGVDLDTGWQTAPKTQNLESFAEIFIYNHLIWVLIGVCVVSYVIMEWFQKRNTELSQYELPKFVFWTLVGVFAALTAALGGLIINYSFIDTETKLDGAMEFFRFNYAWGTHRGFFWIKCIEAFKSFDIRGWLIGIGPDNLKVAFNKVALEESTRLYGHTTNSAHNEYINYLVTHGALGLAAYLGIIVTAVVRAAKKAKENPVSWIFAFVIISYAVQAVVNIAAPMVTPLFFVFLALNENVIRTDHILSTEKKL